MKKLLSVLLLVWTWSNIVMGADPITIPFEMDFINNVSLAPNEGYDLRNWDVSYTSWGVEAKGGKWAQYNTYGGNKGAFCGHKEKTADVWIISPPLPLEVGKGYQITYTVRRSGGNTEKLNVGVAGTRDIDTIKTSTIIYEDHEIINDDWETRTVTFRSDVGGAECCIGFQCVSEPLANSPSTTTYVGLGSFKIETFDMPDPVKPQAATNLSVQVSEEKPLTAVLSWTNPSKGTLDEDLDPAETLTAKIYRNNEEIAVVKDLVAGQAGTYQDKVTEEGDYTYGVSIGLTGTYGETTTATEACKLLKFYPAKITDGQVSSQELDVTLSWTNPAKYTNGLDIKDKMSVEIYRNDELLTTVSDQTAGSAASYLDKVPQEGDYTYYLVPKSIEGTAGEQSETLNAGHVAGAITLPYNALTAEFLNWTFTDENSDGTTWTLATNKDNFSCQCMVGGHDILKSPLLKAGAGNYKLAFLIKRIVVPVDFTINFVPLEGTSRELLKETAYTSEAKAVKYAELSLEADTKFYITVDLKSSAAGGSFVVDNITLKDVITPKPATELTVVPDPNKALKAKISWKNPEAGTNDEAFDNLLSAEIYRNDVLVKTLEELAVGAACEYTDEVPESGLYSYSVRVGFEGTYGEKVTSGEYEVGKVYHPLILPYSIDFTTNAPEGTTDEVNTTHVYYNGTWTVINPNGTLGYGSGGVWNNKTEQDLGAVCRHYGTVAANAWIISPALPLTKDKAYAVTYSYKRIPYGKDVYKEEKFEVGLGTEATPDGLKRKIISTHVVTNNEFITVTKKFTVAEDGDYYIGIHCISEDGHSASTGLAIGSFKTEETTINKPAQVTGLTATGDATKELTVNLAWTNPAKGENGEDLSTDEDLIVEIYRNGDLAKTLVVEPGSNSTWSETVEKAGTYTYIVKVGQYGVFNAGQQATCQLENFVPEKVTDFTYEIQNELDVVLKWTTPAVYTNKAQMAGELTIEIYRDNNLLATEKSEAGSKGQYTDELLEGGTHTYYLIVKLPNGIASEKSAELEARVATGIQEMHAGEGYYDSKLNIFYPAKPASVAVYSIGSTCVLKESEKVSSVNLNALPEGMYLLETEGKVIKIMKK